MQHLVGFRRAVLERNSVRIEYTSQGKFDRLQYGHIGFTGDQATVIRKLREIYCADGLQVIKFMDGDHSQHQNVPVVRAVIHSLNGLQLDRQTQERLMGFLRRLPPVIVKLAPLHRAGFEDFTPYMQLHHYMILNGTCNLAAYVDAAADENERLRRLRVFLACFCLGLIAPQKGVSHGHAAGSKHVSTLQRIIQRVRGL